MLTLGVLLVSHPTGAAEAPVGLGTAGSFAVLAGAGVTNTGPSVINGNLGTCPTPAITGFGPGIVNGATHANNAVACQAKSDLVTAYNDAAGRAPNTTYGGPTELGGSTLVPGVYKSPTSFAITGPLTLNGQGDSNAVFIFQAGSTLTTAVGSSVVLIDGAQACNVFWQVGSSATLGVGSSFVGTIMALADISAGTNASIQGRLLARNGAVTLQSNTVSAPTCTAPPTTVPATTTTTAATTTTTVAATTTTLATTATTEAPAVASPISPSATTATPSPTASPTTPTTRLATLAALPARSTASGTGTSASRTGTAATAGAGGTGARSGITTASGGSATSLSRTGTGTASATGTGTATGSGGSATSINTGAAPGPGETVALARTGSSLWTQTFLGLFAMSIGLVMVNIAGQGTTVTRRGRQGRPSASSGPVGPPVLLLNEPWTPDRRPDRPRSSRLAP